MKLLGSNTNKKIMLVNMIKYIYIISKE